MPARLNLVALICSCAFPFLAARGQEAAPATTRPAGPPPNATSGPITRGQRIYSTGHSFHAGFAAILDTMAKSGGFADNTIVGVSLIGGSQVSQHISGGQATVALATGEVRLERLATGPACRQGSDGHRSASSMRMRTDPW